MLAARHNDDEDDDVYICWNDTVWDFFLKSMQKVLFRTTSL